MNQDNLVGCLAAFVLWLLLLAAIVIGTLAMAPSAGAHDDGNDPRRIDFGPELNSLARCESGDGNAHVRNFGGSGAAGLWQWLPSSWDYVAKISGKPHLVGVDPARATLAQQYRQTRRYVNLAGYSPWVCSAYGDQRPLQVFGDRPTKAPKRCYANLVERWDVPKKTARRICR